MYRVVVSQPDEEKKGNYLRVILTAPSSELGKTVVSVSAIIACAVISLSVFEAGSVLTVRVDVHPDF